MQRVRDHLAELAIGFHGGRDVKGFHGDFDLLKVLLFQQADFPQRGRHHVVNDAVIAFLGLARLGQLVDQVHVPGEPARPSDAAHRRQAAKIHADADGDVALFGRFHHLPHLVLVPQVAGVQPQTVHATRGAFQRQLIVKVDVGNQRYVDLLLDLRHRFGRVHVRHR